jgi:hypothetical protein
MCVKGASTVQTGLPSVALRTARRSSIKSNPAEMDRATVSYNPPLERAIFRRLTGAPTLMLHSMPVPWVGECLLDSSRSQ